MDGRSRPMDVTRRAVLAVTAAGAVAGLAACGSVTAGGAGHPATAGPGSAQGQAAANASAGVPLCVSAQQVDRVVVSPMTSRFRAALPRGITISDGPRVRDLAAALCALPPMPAGMHCPADLGGAVRLTFAAGGRGFQPVAVEESGCRIVSGAGPGRWWARSPQFGQLLTRTVGGRGPLIPGLHPSSVPTA